VALCLLQLLLVQEGLVAIVEVLGYVFDGDCTAGPVAVGVGLVRIVCGVVCTDERGGG